MGGIELVEFVVAGLDEDRHAELGPVQRVHDAQFVAEIGQANDDAIDLLAVLVEEVGALAGVRHGLDGAGGCFSGGQNQAAMAGLLDCASNCSRPLRASSAEKQPRVPTIQAKGEFVVLMGS